MTSNIFVGTCIYADPNEGSLFQETNFREPVHKFSDEDVEKLGLEYYNSEIHKACFVLPQFAKKVSEIV